MDQNITRAILLIQHQRFAEAKETLKGILSGNPVDVTALRLMAEVELALNNADAADALVRTAIAQQPDDASLFHLKARVAVARKKYDEAEESLKHAVTLDPLDADNFATWGFIKLHRKQFAPALELADKALALEPENLLALNTRSTALVKLDRKQEAFTTIEGALREDPTNAYTHSNYGWSLLEKGNHKKALEHFREALTHDPTLRNAQEGMMEALKARYLVYRLFLRYAFWIGNLTAKYQWGFILGFYFGQRALRALAESSPALEPYLIPLIVLLALVAFSTWVLNPLTNLLLRLNPFGKHLLGREEIWSSNFVGGSLVVSVIGFSAYLITTHEPWLGPALVGFAMMVPFGSMFSASNPKYALTVYAGAMAVLGVVAMVLGFTTGELFNGAMMAFGIGFFLYQFVANFMTIKESNQ